MKTQKNKVIVRVIAIVAFLFTSFTTFSQSKLVQEEKQLIIGTWVSNDDPNLKLEFKSNGQHFRYYTGYDTEEYTYTIESGFAPNGSEHTALKLVVVKSDISKIGEVSLFEINGLSNTRLVLDWTGDTRTNLSAYTKQ